jgi:hypothetical protein
VWVGWSAVFFRDVVFSVWCYFAAVISLIIIFIVRGGKKDPVSFGE